MRKPLKIYLFFLLLITAFGVLGNILIQDEPHLNATDINTTIPGSETMVALYEPLAAAFLEEHIVDIAVTPTNELNGVEILLIAQAIDEAALQAHTLHVLQLIQAVEDIQHITIQWLVDDTVRLSASFTQPLQHITIDNLQDAATAYTYTSSN